MIDRRTFLAAGTAAGAVACAAPLSYEDAVQRTWRHSAFAPDSRPALLAELARYATLAANGHNTQPWKFRLRDNGLDILPDFARRTAVVDPDDHHLWVSLGCAAENLVQAAAAFGFEAAPRVSEHGIAVDLTSAAAPVRTALFNAIPLRQSTRGDYDGRPLNHQELRQLTQAALEPDSRAALAMLTDRQSIGRVRDLVISGNTAQMADPAFVEELKMWIRFSRSEAVERGDGLFAGSSGNPAVPRWLGSRLFSLMFTAANENARYAKQMDSSAGVAVFAAPQSGHAGWVAAGRACQRFLLQAAALNIRTAFVNQPVEVPALRPQLAAAAGLGTLRPDLVVRFGRGPTLPASLRRPTAAVIVAN